MCASMTTVAMIEHMMMQMLNLRDTFMRRYKELQETKSIQHQIARKLKPPRSGGESERYLTVGTPVTQRPPHRPGRAVFSHPVPRLYSLSRKAFAL